MNRRSWARQVIHLVDFEQDRFDDVVANKLKVFLPKVVLDVVFGSSKEGICLMCLLFGRVIKSVRRRESRVSLLIQ